MMICFCQNITHDSLSVTFNWYRNDLFFTRYLMLMICKQCYLPVHFQVQIKMLFQNDKFCTSLSDGYKGSTASFLYTWMTWELQARVYMNDLRNSGQKSYNLAERYILHNISSTGGPSWSLGSLLFSLTFAAELVCHLTSFLSWARWSFRWWEVLRVGKDLFVIY